MYEIVIENIAVIDSLNDAEFYERHRESIEAMAKEIVDKIDADILDLLNSFSSN